MEKSLQKKLWFRLFVIAGISIIYASLFYLTYNWIHNTIVIATFSLIFIIAVAWNWGKTAGFLMVIADTVWTGTILHVIDTDNSLPNIESILGLLIHFSIALLTGTAGSLTRRLRHEIEVRTESEKLLKKYQNRLKELVQERTLELNTANEHLHQAEKMEVVGQLAGGIAHDFNNQLMIVMGYCELLLHELEENSPQWNYVKQIDISGRRASDLTKQLLLFARKSVYKPQSININFLITEVISLLSRSLNSIKIVQDFRTENPFIFGGATQIQNALLNLSLNARDAMENGGTLTFRTEIIQLDKVSDTINNHNLTAGNYVSISVIDTGTGIDSNTLKHIFEPFFTTKEEGKGTGMGLAAVYGIVSSHNGGIKVDTSPGKGTTFTLLFPVISKERLNKVNDNSSEKVAGKAHILVIDDEQDGAEMIRSMLETIGYKVSIATNNKEGLELYQKSSNDIDLVMIDMIMAEMNGLEIFKSLKAINPEIKAIISSGNLLNYDTSKIFGDGVKGFLQKPFNINDIAKQIEAILYEASEVNIKN